MATAYGSVSLLPIYETSILQPLPRFATRDGRIYQAWRECGSIHSGAIFWRRIEELPADAEIRD